MPIEPPATGWQFDARAMPADQDMVAVGADLEPATLLTAYRAGLFPMGRQGRRGDVCWWSPDPRGVLHLDRLRVSSSLRRSVRDFEIRIDTAFGEVMAGCADPTRPNGWITPDIGVAYRRLHALGWAHSVECWADDELVGGLYGVGVGGLFAGESMFHRRRDASKVALVALVDLMSADGVPGRFVDVQWSTPHLARLGVEEVPRATYLRMVAEAVALPSPAWPD